MQGLDAGRILTTESNSMDTTIRSGISKLTVSGRCLELLRIPSLDRNAPELVFLHEGLGSVSHWKDFPARVAAATGCPVTVYSRYGSGNSDTLAEPRAVTYMHDEGLVTLPALLKQARDSETHSRGT